MCPLVSHQVVNATKAGVWYVVYTKPASERMALSNLLAQHFEAWLPQMKLMASDDQKPGYSERQTFAPIFPRYVLFRPTRPSQSFALANSLLGVSTVVMLGKVPAALSHQKVSKLAQLEIMQHESLWGQDTRTNVETTDMDQDRPFKSLAAMTRLSAQERVCLLVQLFSKDHRAKAPVMRLVRKD